MVAYHHRIIGTYSILVLTTCTCMWGKLKKFCPGWKQKSWLYISIGFFENGIYRTLHYSFRMKKRQIWKAQEVEVTYFCRCRRRRRRRSSSTTFQGMKYFVDFKLFVNCRQTISLQAYAVLCLSTQKKVYYLQRARKLASSQARKQASKQATYRCI